MILVSTTNYLLLHDIPTGETFVVHEDAGLYYGIAASGDKTYVACRNNKTSQNEHRDLSEEKGELLVLSEELAEIDRLTAPFPLCDLHGIMAYDNKLWLTCTGENFVATYDIVSREWKRWYPSPHVEARGADINHYNSLYQDGAMVYILAHNLGQSELCCYDYPSLDLSHSFALGVHAHDIWIDSGELMTCSSCEGHVVGEEGSAVRIGQFPRGYHCSGEYRVYGTSLLAEREQRGFVDGYLRVFDRENQHCHDVVMPGVGMVLDLSGPVAELDLQRVKDVLELKPFEAEVCNAVELLDTYALGSYQSGLLINSALWHGAEEFRWTAAKKAVLPVVVNKADRRMKIEIYNGNPDAYRCAFKMNDFLLGEATFETMGNAVLEFELPDVAPGRYDLSIEVPNLWRGSRSDASEDERNLGIAVKQVQFLK